jgi:aminoglycoside phosphotransferase (APT) family kinase protein
LNQATGLTEQDIADVCARAFPDRNRHHISEVVPLPSRQHEMVTFRLHWDGIKGQKEESLILRRYVSTISWWRSDDLAKAQREASVTRWLHEQGFPVPRVYAREFSALGDVVLFSRIPGEDWSREALPFPEVVRPHVDRFAQLLAWLHSVKPPQEVRSVTPNVTLTSALANLMALAIQIRMPALPKIVDRVMSQSYRLSETERVLLHGDYHFSNVLLHEGEISGIIDWEYAAMGDPRWDVANAYSQLVDFDAAGAADAFLAAYLHYSGREFTGPPLHMIVVPLQQWIVSEWLVKLQAEGRAPTFALAQDLIELRDVHRRRAEMALQRLEE